VNKQHYDWIEKSVTGLGYEFVHLEWVGRSGLLRLYIDKPNGIALEDCALVSEHLSRAMLVEGIGYERLEVSSPGLDRPLARERDFIKFAGEKARIVLRVPQNGRKNFTGTLGAAVSGSLSLVLDDGETAVIQLSNIDKARLVPQL